MSVIQGTVIPAKGTAGYQIGQSLRFNDDDSAYLSRTPSVVGNRQTWTWSCWVKRSTIGNQQGLMEVYLSNSDVEFIRLDTGINANFYYYNRVGNTLRNSFSTNIEFRDTSSWYHFVFSRNGTEQKLYVNGTEVTPYSEITSTYNSYFNSTNTHKIGTDSINTKYFDGYLAETHFIDGQALTPDYFGEFDATYGHWKPKKYEGTYGTNGFYLPYSNGASIGEDSSGNGNDFIANNLSATDIVLDSPTNNFATFTLLDWRRTNQIPVLAEGNIKTTGNISAGTLGSMQIPSDNKWYYEVVASSNCYIGVTPSAKEYELYTNTVIYLYNGEVKSVNGVNTNRGTSFTTGDVIGVAVDYINEEITFYKNGVFVWTEPLPYSQRYPAVVAVSTTSCYINFGQDSSFAGNKTPQGYTDANGIGDFYYQPPAGYLALCTANLPCPSVVPREHFDVVLDTGANIKTSSEALFPTFLEWIKDRASSNNHQLIDTVRGTSAVLQSNTTGVETTYVTPSGSSVSWLWKAGGTPVTNTDGTIQSLVSVNVDAGFSIVGYTGNGLSNQSFGHGLSKAVELCIIKVRNVLSNTGWAVFGSAIGVDKFLSLNTTAAASTLTGYLPLAPSTTVKFGASDAAYNYNTADYIAYCFHSVEGYSKIGSYTGNGSADGTFVYCNHKPKYVMIKRTDSTGNWIVVDIERGLYNSIDDILYPNLSNAEASNSALDVDFTSNGFKLRTTDANMNASGGVYLFMSFASYPFKFSNAQ